MATMTLRERKQKLADAELDFELARVRARRSTLKRRFKYGSSMDLDLDQVRAMRARLELRFKYGSAPRRHGYSSAEVLRGHGGRELQGLVRDLLAAGRISYNSETACEFHKLTGRELR
jgi:hypothetical protein